MPPLIVRCFLTFCCPLYVFYGTGPLVLGPHIMYVEPQVCCMALLVLVSKLNPSPLLVSPTDFSVCLPDLLKLLYMILDAMRRIWEVLEAWRWWGSALVSHIPFSPSDVFWLFLVYYMTNIAHAVSYPRSIYDVHRVQIVLYGFKGSGKQVQSPTPTCVPHWPLYMHSRPIIIPPRVTYPPSSVLLSIFSVSSHHPSAAWRRNIFCLHPLFEISSLLPSVPSDVHRPLRQNIFCRHPLFEISSALCLFFCLSLPTSVFLDRKSVV